MSQKDKKTTTPKKPAGNYEQKVKLDMSFEEAIRKLAEKANKAVVANALTGKA